MNNCDSESATETATDCGSVGSEIEKSEKPSLNGDNGMDIDEQPNEAEVKTGADATMEVAPAVAVDENSPKDKDKTNTEKREASPSRKRKLDDRDDLSDGSNSSDFLGFPDIRTEEKKKQQEKPKLDLLVFDSAFGKGKRSRIPNRKYESLINIKAVKQSRYDDFDEVTSSEDGRNEDDPDMQKNDDEVSSSAQSSPMHGSRSKKGSVITPARGKQKRVSTDMSNPKLKRPFELGWKRELVYRSTVDKNQQRNGDVYYYTPNGKKIRSMRELAENLHLNPELTMEHFSFWRGPVGINDPEQEIIRDAKMKTSVTPVAKKGTPKKVVKEKPEPSPKPAPTESPPSKPITRSPRLGGFKVKIPAPARLTQSAAKNEKKKAQNQSDSEMEIGMLPPAWSPKKGAAGKGTNWQNKNQATESPSKSKKIATRKSVAVSSSTTKTDTESRFMQNYLQNLSYGYQTLLYVFQYLKVQDLLRAGCVCTLWRDIASHPTLWKTVRMKNSQVSDWEGLADALKKHNTVNLDLRKMLLPNQGDDMWELFSKAIARVDNLVRIELCRCPSMVIENLAKNNKNLQVINAVTIRCEILDISNVNNLENLQELRLKSTNGFCFTSDLTPLKKLTNLKHLSLTSVKDLHNQSVTIIGELVNLETLDLGECNDFPENFGTDVISKLIKLEKLRLEKGQGTCCTFNILDAVSQIQSLEQLELVNFDVKVGFDKALGSCFNLKKLLIIPTYISQSATTNHMVLGGVIKLKSTLSHFVWGVTLELLRVTELFVDQCEDTPGKEKKKPSGSGDSIPVLKPVPFMHEDAKEDAVQMEPPQVEILPLPTLQKLLLNCLPSTRVKILKIPFHATWRQSIVDTVN